MGEGAGQAALFHVRRKIGQRKGREKERIRPKARVASRGIGIRAEAPDIGESSPGGAKSVKAWMFAPTPLKGSVAPKESSSVIMEHPHVSSRDSGISAVMAT